MSFVGYLYNLKEPRVETQEASGRYLKGRRHEAHYCSGFTTFAGNLKEKQNWCASHTTTDADYVKKPDSVGVGVVVVVVVVVQTKLESTGVCPAMRALALNYGARHLVTSPGRLRHLDPRPDGEGPWPRTCVQPKTTQRPPSSFEHGLLTQSRHEDLDEVCGHILPPTTPP